MTPPDPKPQIVPPAGAATPAVEADPVLRVEFVVPQNPTIQQVIRLHAQIAEFLNAFVAEALRSKVVSAGTPTTQGAMQASAALEQSAQQVQAMIQQRMMPQQQGPPPGMPPIRMN